MLPHHGELGFDEHMKSAIKTITLMSCSQLNSAKCYLGKLRPTNRVNNSIGLSAGDIVYLDADRMYEVIKTVILYTEGNSLLGEDSVGTSYGGLIFVKP